MPDTPDSEAGVALELLRIIVRGEGTPIEALTEQTKPNPAGNQPIRSYVLDTYVECLRATRGERQVVVATN